MIIEIPLQVAEGIFIGSRVSARVAFYDWSIEITGPGGMLLLHGVDGGRWSVLAGAGAVPWSPRRFEICFPPWGQYQEFSTGAEWCYKFIQACRGKPGLIFCDGDASRPLAFIAAYFIHNGCDARRALGRLECALPGGEITRTIGRPLVQMLDKYAIECRGWEKRADLWREKHRDLDELSVIATV